MLSFSYLVIFCDTHYARGGGNTFHLTVEHNDRNMLTVLHIL